MCSCKPRSSTQYLAIQCTGRCHNNVSYCSQHIVGSGELVFHHFMPIKAVNLGLKTLFGEYSPRPPPGSSGTDGASQLFLYQPDSHGTKDFWHLAETPSG